ncbi:9496_t:CDS:2 [Ambispora gerdemannii]|uniref:9496_t:CDS:1 n=1 Tax=Ambispora gerdemannii TaxID=144530 RepID=A0A9N9CMP5_9GLOM|nr:9496_t:CDS:2 [Ambispora gerdemannii]
MFQFSSSLHFASVRLFRFLRVAVGLTLIVLAVFYSFVITSTFINDRYRQHFFETKYIDPHKDLSIFVTNSKRLKAVIVILVRNSELEQLLPTLRQLEERWNKKYNYPYVYLNDVVFTSEFIEKTSAVTNAKTYHDIIPSEMWSYPSWIDQTKAARSRARMQNDHVPYGGLESYYHMCRFNSGFFFRHPLLKEYDYYWRVEPGVEFNCNIDYDPFAFIQKNNISYGFTISLKERANTIPTLWQNTKQFIKDHPQFISPRNSAKLISDNDMETYNLSEAYLKFFEYLDKAGGFFYERWGDAPIHSIAAALFLEKTNIHFFNDIAYKHRELQHCPPEQEIHESGKCQCDPKNNFGNKHLLSVD